MGCCGCYRRGRIEEKTSVPALRKPSQGDLKDFRKFSLYQTQLKTQWLSDEEIGMVAKTFYPNTSLDEFKKSYQQTWGRNP